MSDHVAKEKTESEHTMKGEDKKKSNSDEPAILQKHAEKANSHEGSEQKEGEEAAHKIDHTTHHPTDHSSHQEKGTDAMFILIAGLTIVFGLVVLFNIYQ